MIASRTLATLCAATLVLAACKKPQDEAAAPEAQTATTAPADAPANAPTAPEAAQPQAAPAQAFDITAVALSDKPLGEWPYIAAPAGYTFEDDTALGTKDLARVPFWTGSQLVWVEGKTYESGIGAAEGKTFSRFELLKGVDQALTALGAVKLVDKGLDQEAYEASKDEVAAFTGEFGEVYGAYVDTGNTSVTYLIRRADKAIWAVVTSSSSGAGLLIAEGPLPEAPPAQ